MKSKKFKLSLNLDREDAWTLITSFEGATP
jgi:hypothetical protein